MRMFSGFKSLFYTKNRLRFEIKRGKYEPIDDASLVKIFETQYDLGGIETSSGRGKRSLGLEMMEKFAAIDVIHHEIQFVLRLKARV